MHEEGFRKELYSSLPGEPLPREIRLKKPSFKARVAGFAMLNLGKITCASLVAVFLAIFVFSFVSSLPEPKSRSLESVAAETAQTGKGLRVSDGHNSSPSPKATATVPLPAAASSNAANLQDPELLAMVTRIETALDRAEKVSRQADLVGHDKKAVIKIAEGNEKTSGFWMPSEDGTEQHFIVVEAVGQDGKPELVDVEDMMSGTRHRTSSFAVLVPEDEFIRLAAEKSDNGTFANPVAGSSGKSGIDWSIKTDGRILVNWQEHAE